MCPPGGVPEGNRGSYGVRAMAHAVTTCRESWHFRGAIQDYNEKFSLAQGSARTGLLQPSSRAIIVGETPNICLNERLRWAESANPEAWAASVQLPPSITVAVALSSRCHTR